MTGTAATDANEPVEFADPQSTGQLQIPPPVPLPTFAPHWFCR